MGLLDKIRPAKSSTLDLEVGWLTLSLEIEPDLAGQARAVCLERWEQLDTYLRRNPAFASEIAPEIPDDEEKSSAVISMANASRVTGAKPGHCVAGAMVDAAVKDLLKITDTLAITCEGVSFAVGKPARLFVVDPVPRKNGLTIAVRVSRSQPYAVFTSARKVVSGKGNGGGHIGLLAGSAAVAQATGWAAAKSLEANGVDDTVARLRTTDQVDGGVLVTPSHIATFGNVEIATPEASL